MQPQPNHWYAPLRQLASLGSSRSKIRHMGDLAKQRRQTLSQYFTPDEVAGWMWSFVSHLEITSVTRRVAIAATVAAALGLTACGGGSGNTVNEKPGAALFTNASSEVSVQHGAVAEYNIGGGTQKFVSFSAASSDTKVATVVVVGTTLKITGVSAGEATVTVTDSAGGSVKITVKVPADDGSRVIATFEDPNCGFCRKLMTEVEKLNNVTVYTFLFPVLGPDSALKAKAIWCAKDQSAAWTGFMTGKATSPPGGNCETPLERNIALQGKLRINGTPAILFIDNTKTPGYVTADVIEAKFKK